MNEEQKRKFANLCAKRFLKQIEEKEIVDRINEIIYENEQLHSIIKEVREWVDKNRYKSDGSIDSSSDEVDNLLEILDKE